MKYLVRSIKIIIHLFFILSLQRASAQSQDTIKLLSYNLLHYPNVNDELADTSLRNPFFRTVMQSCNPDILVVSELMSSSGLTGFLNSVLNANALNYGKSTYVPSNDSERGLFYKTSKFIFISNTPIATQLRDINEFKLVHLASGDTIRIYAVHLKASAGGSNETQRSDEVETLRTVTNALPVGSNFMVCGDFNIYNNSEPAYQKLIQLQSGNEGHVIDPLNLSGSWNNSSYSIHHTQATRTRSFGGGATGGMDDRFDMILFSKSISEVGGIQYLNGSLTAYGNDGNHYNDSINHPPNTAVGNTIATALHNASDHLPVISKFSIAIPSAGITDISAIIFLPLTTTCPATNTIRVKIKNVGTNVVLFSTNPITIHVDAISPLGDTVQFVKSISSGQLNPSVELIINMTPDFPMLNPGSYQMNAFIAGMGNDVNSSNDTFPTTFFTVSNFPSASILPAGTVQLCDGSSTVLTASGGVSYLWSTGNTNSTLLVNAAGTYLVTVTGVNGCTISMSSVVVNSNSSTTGQLIFDEAIGTVSGTTTIDLHEINNGFNNNQLLMSGTGDVRVTLPSTGYTQASGGANIFLTNTIGKYFTISGINTLQLFQPVFSFGIYKSITASSGADLKVQVSTDGINFTDLAFPSLPSGANWNYRTCSGFIPSSVNLSIRFINMGSTTQYRIDDVSLAGVLAVPLSSCAPYSWNGSNYSLSGFYSTIFTNSMGCDSLAAISLSILNPSYDTTIVSTCGSYFWQDSIYTNSGTYQHVELNAAGCDSISVLELIIYTTSTVVNIISSSGAFHFCPNDTFVLFTDDISNGETYLWSTGAITPSIIVQSEGIYSVSVTNSLGCVRSSPPILISLNTRPSDFDKNGITNVSDLLSIVALLNLSCSSCPQDLNNDEVVNVSDILLFVAAFGLSCD